MKIGNTEIITNFEPRRDRLLRNHRSFFRCRPSTRGRVRLSAIRNLKPQKLSQLYSEPFGKYRLVCNFSEGTIALLDPPAQEILDLCDGEKEIATIWRILSLKRKADFTLGDAWNLGKRKISFRAAYRYLKYGKTSLNLRELTRIFFIFNRAGLIKGMELPRRIETTATRQLRPLQRPRVGMTPWGLTLKPVITINPFTINPCEIYFYLDEDSPFDYPYPSGNLISMSRETGFRAIDSIFNFAQKNGFDRIFLKFFISRPEKFSLLKELFSYYKKKSVENFIEVTPSLFTNWQLVNSNFLKDIRQMQANLVFLLDGIGQIHDQQSKLFGRQGSFQEAQKAMNLLQKEKYPFFIIVTVTSLNLAGLKKLTTYLLSKKIPFAFHFIQKTPWLPKELFPDKEKLIESLFDVYKIITKKIPPQSIFSNILGRNFPLLREKAKLNSLSCCQKETGLEIKKIEFELKPTKNCSTCQFKQLCLNSYPLITSYYSFQYDNLSDYCEVYQSLIPQALRVEAKRLISQK